MVLSAKQKQKKRQQRAAKRKKSGATKRLVSAGRSARSMAKRYARFPVHEALGAGDLANEGIGSLLLSRRGPDGLLGVSFFLVDTYCLGVKNAFFVEVDDDVYLEVKQRMLDSQEVTPSYGNPHVFTRSSARTAQLTFVRALDQHRTLGYWSGELVLAAST